MNTKHFSVGRILGALLVSLALSIPAFADPVLPRPFDPEKIPLDNGWEESLVSHDSSAPCGKSLLYEGWESILNKDWKYDPNEKTSTGWRYKSKKKISVRDVKTNVVREIAFLAVPTFKGCTPDSRYLFIDANINGGALEVFDTQTMRQVHSWPWKEPSGHSGRLLSPDGHYLAWFTDEEIMLGGDWKLKTIPLLRDSSRDKDSLAWSPDSRKVYLLPDISTELFFIYDVPTKKLDTVRLIFDLPHFAAIDIKVHPETGVIYIFGGLIEDYFFYYDKYLFSLDPANIPNGGKSVKVPTKRVGDVFVTFAFGPDKTILFSMMSLDEMSGDMFPEEYNGIFVADLDGNILRRITKGTYDYAPYYWKEQDTILFKRATRPDGFLVEKVISIKRKTNTPAH